MFRALPPERRRRGDMVVAAVIVVLLGTAVVVLSRTSEIAGTESRPSAVPIAAPPGALAAPGGFVEAWRADSPATFTPVVSGPAVVTAGGSEVLGRDALTGEVRWSYRRDLPLCTVANGFPSIVEGRVLALYQYGEPAATGAGPYCSELTALDGDTGERARARNPDVRPGTRLIADDTYLLATGSDHVEALRYDMVRTVEYGDIPAQEQNGRQPRPDCTYGSAALGGRRVAVLERCPGEAGDRITVLASDGADGSETPEQKSSTLLPGTGAVVLAVTSDRVAVALPDPARLLVFDGAGNPVAATELDLPAADLAADPPAGVAATSDDSERRYWWTGSTVVALDASELAVAWTLPGTLGPPVVYGSDLLVPVPGGLAVADGERGTLGRVLPVDRADPSAPVILATQGEVLLEQRGSVVVALRPAP